jgi:NAD-dependent dihydropyrimidine dehydrogenase PreA subunit
MAKRKIIRIDEDKCNGCGECVPNCAEGALKIIGGKARLVSDVFCDGLGACLGHCPQGAITIEEREAEAFDEKKAHAHKASGEKLPCGCPGSMSMDLKRRSVKAQAPSGARTESELSQWPVQIRLVPPEAPYFNGADLLIAADCVPFAYPDFHRDLLRGKAVLVGCPKLDDLEHYRDKIGRILKANAIKSVTYAHMEVPCCFGLIDVIKQAIAASGKKIPFSEVTVGIRGELKR